MDLKKNRLPIAGAAFALLLGAAIYASRTQYDAPRSEAEATPSLPELTSDAVTALTIARPDEAAIELVREGETWKVKAPVEAAADQAAVRTALTRLGELEVVRVAASRAENHERLGVDAAHALRLTVKTGETTALDLLVGNVSGNQTLVRLPDQDAVLAVQGSLAYALNKPLKDWRDRVILSLAPEAVTAVRLENAAGSFAFTRGEGDAFALAEGTAPIERFDAAKVRSLVTTLARLRATDFAAADAAPASLGLDAPWATVTLTTRFDPPAPEGEAAEGGEAPPSPTPPAETREHVVRIGAEAPGGRYLQVEGNPVVFVLATALAERLHPDATDFQAPEPGSEPEPAPEPPAGGAHQLPPELLQQLQQQLGQAGR